MARQAGNLTLEDLKTDVRDEEFAKSLKGTKPVYTWIILACLIAVGICQPVFESKKSIEAAGLVKDAVRQGEWWRLLTCATLHVNFMHIWTVAFRPWKVNGIGDKSLPPLSYLYSVDVCGSLFSLLLLPSANSARASGGLIGLIGFLAVVGYRRKESLPRKFFKSIVICICFIGVIGLIGFAIIDNAAHLGGLIAGGICGSVTIKRVGQTTPIEASAAVKPLGWPRSWPLPGFHYSAF